MSNYNVEVLNNETNEVITRIDVLAISRFDACKKALSIVNEYMPGRYMAVSKN